MTGLWEATGACGLAVAVSFAGRSLPVKAPQDAFDYLKPTFGLWIFAASALDLGL